MGKEQVSINNLRLMVFESAEDLGKRVDEHLLERYKLDKSKYTFIVPLKEVVFEDGHLKTEIQETVRGKDLYLLTDIGNYSITYNIHGFTNHMSPNDYIIQLKDGIGACNRHAKHLNIVMPLLYAGRQHRRNTRENLLCGATLHELDQMKGIRSFITFDAHDQSVEHAVQNMEFENFYPTNTILDSLISDMPIDQLENVVFVAPDNGATGRRNVYLSSFNSPHIHREAGSFIKERDFNHLVNGKYPVIAHDYCGNNELDGYTAIISDDMISSGGSMFDTLDELAKLGVTNSYVVVTYALFTRGINDFEKYYREGKLSGVYTTNLSFIPEEYQQCEWLHVCDCSRELSDIIYSIHNDISISDILRDKSKPIRKIEEKFKVKSIGTREKKNDNS